VVFALAAACVVCLPVPFLCTSTHTNACALILHTTQQVSVSEAISNAGVEQTSWTQLTTTTTTTTTTDTTTSSSKVKLAGQVRVTVTFRRQTDIDKEAAVLQERALHPGAAVQKRRASLLADSKDAVAEIAGRAAVRCYYYCYYCCYLLVLVVLPGRHQQLLSATATTAAIAHAATTIVGTVTTATTATDIPAATATSATAASRTFTVYHCFTNYAASHMHSTSVNIN
jgi:hypothetical protein